MRIVLDTNVLVSAMITPGGLPARVWAAVLSRSVVVLYDDRIMAEYEEILTRPKFHIPLEDVHRVLQFIYAEGILVTPAPVALQLPDLDDLAFIEVAMSGKADAIVTGNARHFTSAQPPIDIPVLSPSEFLRLNS